MREWLHCMMESMQINERWNDRAKCCFAPILSLFIDDCIDRETGWFQGGARYTYAIHSDSGMPNTIDSLLAIRDLVYEKKRYTPERFLTLLKAEDDTFFAELKKLSGIRCRQQSIGCVC